MLPHDLWLRLRALLMRNQVEQELDEELSFHLEMQTLKNRQAGMSDAEARQQALRHFGQEAIVKEECRDQRRVNLIETLLQDVRYALRGFRRAPMFALTVVLTIGLGLGLNTALFTIFDTYVLRPLAVTDPQSLYQLNWRNREGRNHAFSWPQFQDLRNQNPAFSELYAAHGMQVRVNGHQMFAELVTGNYFRMLGANAALGRTITPEDTSSPGREPVMVLSYTAWRNSFGGDPGILGKKVFVRGYPLEVVGVAREDFAGLEEVPQDFWAPLSMYEHLEEGPGVFSQDAPETLSIIGRLRVGTSEAQARAVLTTWAQRLTAGLVESERAVTAVLQSRATPVHMSPQALLILTPIFTAFGLVLLIACANVANMMLARSMARQREIGIRLSLGAARSRLIRQLLTESLLLALPGALAGFAISRLAIDAGVALLLATLPAEFAEYVRIVPLNSDARVFAFMIGVAALSGILFGLAPAIQATRPNVVQASRGDFTNELRPQRLRNALVVSQVAVCVLLLICAGILLRGANRASAIDSGFRTRDVIWIDLLDKSRAQVIARIVAEPGVGALAASSTVPLESGFPSALMSGDGGNAIVSSYCYVSPEFFGVFDIPIERGRNITTVEAISGAPVAIVSATLAKRLWPGMEPVGQILRIAPDSRSHASSRDPARYPSVQVIGVARDVIAGFMDSGFKEDDTNRRQVYFPTTVRDAGNALLVRVSGDPETMRQNLDRGLAAAAPGGVNSIHKMQELVAGRLYPFRMAYWVAAILGMLALVLTGTGIYGVLSYLVEQRVREIGLRMALGATVGSIIALVVRQSLKLAMMGIVIGGALSLGASRLLASLLVVMNTFDSGAYAGGVVIALSACVAAACVPSLRAARVDPVTTLRHD